MAMINEPAAVFEYGAKIKNETGKTSFKVLKCVAKELGESMTDDGRLGDL